MCRYSMSGLYKQHYACFSCRKVVRYEPRGFWALDPFGATPRRRRWIASGPAVVCSDCGGPAIAIGRDFKAPPRRDVRQWEKARLLALAGFGFDSCGCGPGPRPKRLSEVDDFLRENGKPPARRPK